MIGVLGLVTMACVGEVGVCKIYAHDGSIRMFSKKTILIKEVPRVHQDDVTVSTRVPYAFSWSYSPSKYL